MGIASVLKLVSRKYEILGEEDFDETIEAGLSAITAVLPKHHVFRRLVTLLDTGTEDENLLECVGKIVEEASHELGFTVITPEQLSEFVEYLQGDIDKQWDDLFPGKRAGFLGWIRYNLWQKPLESQFKEKPKQANVTWYKDTYSDLLHFLKKAMENDCLVLRERY
jgi:hypothetical protein